MTLARRKVLFVSSLIVAAFGVPLVLFLYWPPARALVFEQVPVPSFCICNSTNGLSARVSDRIMGNSIHDAIAVSIAVGWPGPGLNVCYRDKPSAGNTTYSAHPQNTCPVTNQYIMASSAVAMKSDHQAMISFSLRENADIRSKRPLSQETVKGSVFVDRRTKACLLELENWNFSLTGRVHCGNYKTYWYPRSAYLRVFLPLVGVPTWLQERGDYYGPVDPRD